MKTYLKPLHTKITNLLPKNSYFTLDDSEHSFVVYPTNHVTLGNDFINIEVATIVYGNLKEHTSIIDNIKSLMELLTSLSDNIGYDVFLNPVGDCFRLSWE